MNKQTTAPDWSFWGNLPDVMIWQAVALSLNTDPASLDMPGGFDPDRCTDLPSDFKPRLSVACGNQMQLGVCRSMMEQYHAPYQLSVNLQRFGIWAGNLRYPWHLPHNFPGTENKSRANNEVQPDLGENEIANNSPVKQQASWVVDVRAIGLEYIAKHKKNNLFPSQSDVCGHIETMARERKIYGPQGKPISQSYIQRNAIQGEWWRKNKP